MIDASLVHNVTTNEQHAQLLLQLTSGRKLGTTINLRDVQYYLNEYIATENTPKAKAILADYQQHIQDHKVVGFQPFARSPESDKCDISILGQSIRTTMGQLRFLTWCINIGLLEHLNRILGHIKQQKKLFEAERKQKKRHHLPHQIETRPSSPIAEEPDDLVIRFSFD